MVGPCWPLCVENCYCTAGWIACLPLTTKLPYAFGKIREGGGKAPCSRVVSAWMQLSLAYLSLSVGSQQCASSTSVLSRSSIDVGGMAKLSKTLLLAIDPASLIARKRPSYMSFTLSLQFIG